MDNEYGISHGTHVISSAVFGWFQDSFIGIERDLRYSLQAGYQKGASYYVNTSFRFDVVSRMGSASMSSYDNFPLYMLKALCYDNIISGDYY